MLKQVLVRARMYISVFVLCASYVLLTLNSSFFFRLAILRPSDSKGLNLHPSLKTTSPCRTLSFPANPLANFNPIHFLFSFMASFKSSNSAASLCDLPLFVLIEFHSFYFVLSSTKFNYFLTRSNPSNWNDTYERNV